MARCENISSGNKVYESRARNVADARGCEVKVEGSGETAKWMRKAGNEYRPRGREDAGDVSAVVLSFLNWTRGSGHLSARPFTLFPSRNQPSSLAASLFRLFSQGTSVLSSSARTYRVSSRQAIYLISSRVTAVLARPEHLPTGQSSR